MQEDAPYREPQIEHFCYQMLDAAFNNFLAIATEEELQKRKEEYEHQLDIVRAGGRYKEERALMKYVFRLDQQLELNKTELTNETCQKHFRDCMINLIAYSAIQKVQDRKSSCQDILINASEFLAKSRNTLTARIDIIKFRNEHRLKYTISTEGLIAVDLDYIKRSAALLLCELKSRVSSIKS